MKYTEFSDEVGGRTYSIMLPTDVVNDTSHLLLRNHLVTQYIEDCVSAGANWLDNISSDWAKKIDVSSFDIEDPKMCICGQLFMNGMFEKIAEPEEIEEIDNSIRYYRGEENDGYTRVSRLMGEQFCVAHGFNTPDYSECWNEVDDWGDIEPSDTEHFDRIAREWIFQIKKRTGK